MRRVRRLGQPDALDVQSRGAVKGPPADAPGLGLALWPAYGSLVRCGGRAMIAMQYSFTLPAGKCSASAAVKGVMTKSGSLRIETPYTSRTEAPHRKAGRPRF